MLKFAAGFVFGLLAVVPIVLLLVRKKKERVDQSKSRQSRDLEQLSKLTGQLAHEIKNPLSTIMVNLKLISEELTEAAVGCRQGQQSSVSRVFSRSLRKTEVISKEADRLEQILDGFLRYVDRTELKVSNADVNELVSDMIDFYSPQAHSHSITIREGLSGEQLICKIDSDMLKQVLLNLFINAQQAMNGGGELIIRTAKQDGAAIIEVADTGCGIETDKLENIFEAYYSSRPQGSGLGLPTAKRIIEDHHGTLSVTSEPDKGTSFVIKLPLADKDNQ